MLHPSSATPPCSCSSVPLLGSHLSRGVSRRCRGAYTWVRRRVVESFLRRLVKDRPAPVSGHQKTASARDQDGVEDEGDRHEDIRIHCLERVCISP
jgi:hypothetical protein